MAHGYLREYDEGWDRDGDRERGERDWNDRERGQRDWNERDRSARERWSQHGHDQDRGMMFGDRDHQRSRDDREYWNRPHSAFTSEEGQGNWRSSESRGAWENNGDWPSRHRHSDDARQRFSSHPDDHYRSWRDRQMQSLDRDYEDYCREREAQFHSDFDSWREQRSAGNPGPLRTGMAQTGMSQDPSGQTQAESDMNMGSTPANPTDTATLGTNPSSRSKR